MARTQAGVSHSLQSAQQGPQHGTVPEPKPEAPPAPNPPTHQTLQRPDTPTHKHANVPVHRHELVYSVVLLIK